MAKKGVQMTDSDVERIKTIVKQTRRMERTSAQAKTRATFFNIYSDLCETELPDGFRVIVNDILVRHRDKLLESI